MKLPETMWIKEITLHVFASKVSEPISMKLEFKKNVYVVTPSSYPGIRRALKRKRLVFMSLKTTANLTGIFSHYEQESPWTFQVEVNKRTQEVADDHYAVEVIPGYVIQRHTVNGEIPDHQNYTKMFDRTEYNYPWGVTKRLKKKKIPT